MDAPLNEQILEFHVGKHKYIIFIFTGNPKVEVTSFLVTVLEEETARLECKVDAASHPFSNVSWSQNSRPVSKQTIRHLSIVYLSLRDVEW